MSHTIESQLPSYAFHAMRLLSEAGKQAFIVGGFLRDCLLENPAHDIDIATDSLWYQTKAIFEQNGYQVISTGVKHGTVTVLIDDRPVEVTTFRTDGTYSDHRRPDVVRFVNNVEDDLARRDFTVNAMAWNPSRGLVDPHGGLDDLHRRCICAVGDPTSRFTEDALRVMRAVRFCSKLGFSMDTNTAQAVHACADELDNVARERIRTEYDGIVAGKDAVNTLRDYPDIAAKAIPGIERMVGFDHRSRWHVYDVWEHCLHALENLSPNANLIVRHATLLHDVAKPVCQTFSRDGYAHYYGHEEYGSRMLRGYFRDLRWSTPDIDRLTVLVRHHDHHIEPTVRGIRRVLSRINDTLDTTYDETVAVFGELLMIKRADTLAHAPSCVARRMREIDGVEQALQDVVRNRQAFCVRDLAVGGDDLMQAGVVPGPEMGRVLRQLLHMVIDGEIDNDRASLMEFLVSRSR